MACTYGSFCIFIGQGWGRRPDYSVWFSLVMTRLVLWPRAWDASSLLFQLFSGLLSLRLVCSCFINETIPPKDIKGIVQVFQGPHTSSGREISGARSTGAARCQPLGGHRSEEGVLSPKRAKPKRAERFKRFSNPSFWWQEMYAAPINKLYYKTARKWASWLGPSVHYLWLWGNPK